MVPETFHVVDSDLDGLNILDSFIDEVWLSELLGIESEVFDLLLESGELIEYTVKLLLSEFGSAFVLEEFSLLHLLVEASDLFFELFDVGLVSIVLLLNQWSNLLLGVFGDLFEVNPVLVDLNKSLQLWVLGQLVKLEQLKGLVELIDLESDSVGVFLSLLDLLLD